MCAARAACLFCSATKLLRKPALSEVIGIRVSIACLALARISARRLRAGSRPAAISKASGWAKARFA